jgi:signal transduction histidine kinase/ActR/RegA family two-component response regulator
MMSLRSHLVALVVVALLPLLVFAVIVLGLAADNERDATERGLRSTTRAVAVAVDHALDNTIGALELLATSERLDARDRSGFHGIAARALESQRGWLGVALVDPVGGQVLNTLRPLGAELPPAADMPWVTAAIARRVPVVSDLIGNGLPGRPHVMVAVPVLRDRLLRGVLVAAVDVDAFTKLLAAQQVPRRWVAAIADGEGTIVARVPDAERYVGQRLSPGYLELTTAGDGGSARGIGHDRVSRHTAFDRLQHARWTVLLGLPADDMDASLHGWLWAMAGGGVLFLASGIVLAVVAGRRLTAPIVALSAAAARVGAGEPPEPPASSVREVAALGASLTDAARRRREIEVERTELLARAEAARERASLLAEVSTLLAASLDYESALQRLARALIPRLADLCVVDLVNDDGTIRRVAAAHADPAKEEAARNVQTRFPPGRDGDHPVARALRSGRAELAADISPDALQAIAPDPEHRRLAHTMDYTSYLVVPLIARGRTLGALSLVSAGSGRRYTADDVPLAEDVARRVAVAVDNARLFSQSESRLRASEMLVEVGRSLNQTLDPEVVGQRIAESVRTLLGFGSSVFYRVDPDTLEMTVVATSGETMPPLVPGTLLTAGSATVGLAVRQRRPVTTPDVLADPRIVLSSDMRAQLERATYRSVLAVPLLSHERLLGVLALGDRPGRQFRPEEVLLAQGFAEEAALALENARLYAEAREVNRAKDEFLATLSHELRTPLTAMLGWVRMLQSGTLDPATTERALQVIDRNTKLQAQLIDDLLDVSRIITGKLALDFKAVDVGAVLDAALEAVTPGATAKSITIERRLDPVAPPVWADAHRLEQIVWNLLSNAIKFTPANGRVTVTVGREDPHAVVRVSDTGQGVPAEFLPYIFERFRQADATSTRAHGGLGLGLAIVHHLVTLHRGSVSAESDGPGRGATFTVRIPLAPVRTLPRHGADAAIGIERFARLAGVRVLVVDDEADARELIAAVLGQSGAEVATAASAAEALDSLTRLQPHVLVSDISMPGDDGYALLRRVRELSLERHGRVPAVALTAYARAEDRERALAVGFASHVPKPVEPAELVDVVARLAAR